MSEENPYVVVPEDNVRQINVLLNKIGHERTEIINLLEKSKGVDWDSFNKTFESQSQNMMDEIMKKIDSVNVAQRSPAKSWKNLFHWSVFAGIIAIMVLALGVTVYSLKNLNSLETHWENIIKEKMERAIDIEKTIDFFEETKEKQNARESD